jgi:glutamyl-tRNA synthetase
MNAPRVRFAPAPTGFLHVGGGRTALFNWLYARHTGGTFVLRIEDTDLERNREEWVEGIESTLRWLGLDWDEGPIRQSSRSPRYAEALATLLEARAAYYCDCDRAAVEQRAKAAGRATPGYDGYCRERGLPAAADRVVRFAVPRSGEIRVNDLIRGEVVFANSTLEDFVIARPGGAITFYLANAVDDADMAISHVIRGEDLLSSTPRVLLLRHALGFAADPVYAHLPLLVGADRQKLSKRHGDVSLEDYRAKGYLPEALRNYLALLGWAPGDDSEIMPIEQIVELFSLDAVTKSPAFFDHAKLDHINGHYIRELSAAEFRTAAQPFVSAGPWPTEAFDEHAFATLAPLVQERVKRLDEIPGYVDFLFMTPPIDEASWQKAMGKDPELAAGLLTDAMAAYASMPRWEAGELHAVTLACGEARGVKLGKAQAPIRVAATGKSVGPPLFESLEVLGRDEVLGRLRAALARLGT